MLENEIKITDMPNAGALRDTDYIPLVRDNAPDDPSNEGLFGSALQARMDHPEITSLMGSSNSLLKLITLGRPLRSKVTFYLDSQEQTWRLFEGDEESDESASSTDPAVRGTTEIVRPEDWAETTNERVWKRTL